MMANTMNHDDDAGSDARKSSFKLLLEEENLTLSNAESEFRRSLEAALRTGLSSTAAIAWAEFGPFPHQLNFFSPIIAIVVTLNSAGDTIEAHRGCLHGVLFGAILALCTMLISRNNAIANGFLLFLSFFLVVKRHGMTPLGRKIACVTVAITVLTFDTYDSTESWIRSILAWCKTVFEGGIWALIALMIPYPRLALREGAGRAQYVCKLMDFAIANCISGFKHGRDDRLVSRSFLLVEQIRLNLDRLNVLVEPCRLESVLLFCGQAGGLGPIQALELVVKNMTARVECIEGMQQAIMSLKLDTEQQAFVGYLEPYLMAMNHVASEVLSATEEVMNLKYLLKRNRIIDQNKHMEFENSLKEVEFVTAALLDAFQTATFHIYYGIDLKIDGPETIGEDNMNGSELLLKNTYIDEEKLPKFSKDLHEGLVLHWRRHGYHQSFARGSFIFSLVTVSTLLARLLEVQEALKDSQMTSPVQRFQLSLSIMGRQLLDMLPKINAKKNFRKIRDWLRLGFRNRGISGDYGQYHRVLIHPLKIAFILTTCSLFVLVGPLSDYVAAGAWIAVTASFIVSEDSSSAAVTSNLRLIGSVTGAMYGWFLTEIVTNQREVDLEKIRFRAGFGLPPWIAFCCFFRNSKSHGYAAVTSAFTSVVIVLGTFSSAVQGSSAPLVRIQNTIIGVAIYMLIDNVCFPVRTKFLLNEHLVSALSLMKGAVSTLKDSFLGEKGDNTDAQVSPKFAEMQENHNSFEKIDLNRNGTVEKHRISGCSTVIEVTCHNTMEEQQIASHSTIDITTNSTTGEHGINGCSTTIDVTCHSTTEEPRVYDHSTIDVSSNSTTGEQHFSGRNCNITTEIRVYPDMHAPFIDQSNVCGKYEFRDIEMGSSFEVTHINTVNSADVVHKYATFPLLNGGNIQVQRLYSSDLVHTDMHFSTAHTDIQSPMIRTDSQSSIAHTDGLLPMVHEYVQDHTVQTDRQSPEVLSRKQDSIIPMDAQSPINVLDVSNKCDNTQRRKSDADKLVNRLWYETNDKIGKNNNKWDWRKGINNKQILPPVNMGSLGDAREALVQQSRYIHLCSFEPTLWHKPFHAQSYINVLTAEKEVLAALVQLKRASHSFSAICTAHTWGIEVEKMSAVMSHAHTLLKLIEDALMDAEGVFLETINVSHSVTIRSHRALHALAVQAEADRLKEAIDSEMLEYMMDRRGVEPQISLQFSLRFNTTIFSMMQLQGAIQKLGYAITAVLERESQIFFYT